MPKPKRTKHQREMDYVLENQLHLQGYRNWEIAEHISKVRPYSITNAQVGQDLKLVRQRWQERTTIKLDEHKLKELERLDMLERENWDQFDNSKRLDREGRPLPGDPQFLQAIERIVELRMKLLGLEAPKQTHISGTIEANVSARVAVLAKLEQMANRVSLYPSGGGEDNLLPHTLPDTVAARIVKEVIEEEAE